MKFLPIILTSALLLLGGGTAEARTTKKKKNKKVSAKKKLSVVAAASGAQEVPPVATHTTAHVSLKFDEGFTKASYQLDIWKGVAITQVHLHCAAAGSNGAIVAFLFNVAPVPGPGGVHIDGTASHGELTNAEIVPVTCASIQVNNIASLYEAILNRLIYVNVHSEANPPGEVRGQIFP